MAGRRNSQKRSRTEENGNNLSEFRQKVTDGTKLSITDVAQMLLAMNDFNAEESKARHDEILDTANEMKNKTDAHAAVLDQHEARIRVLEMKELAANVIFKKVPMHQETKEDGKESPRQTEEMVRKALSIIKMEDKVTIRSCKRFRQNKDNRGNPPFIQVILGDRFEKVAVFRAMAATRPTNLQIDREFPLSMKKELTDLRVKAQQIREDSNYKTKARVEVRGIVPRIMGKEEGENAYHEI